MVSSKEVRDVSAGLPTSRGEERLRKALRVLDDLILAGDAHLAASDGSERNYLVEELANARQCIFDNRCPSCDPPGCGRECRGGPCYRCEGSGVRP
jgi:hypothetical protein